MNLVTRGYGMSQSLVTRGMGIFETIIEYTVFKKNAFYTIIVLFGKSGSRKMVLWT